MRQSIATFDLLVVVAALVVVPEAPPAGLVRTVVIAILLLDVFVRFVDDGCLAEERNSLFVEVAVEIRQSEHVVNRNEKVVEALDRKVLIELAKKLQGSLVGSDGVGELVDVVVELSELSLNQERILGGSQFFEDLDGAVLIVIGSLFVGGLSRPPFR